MKTRILNTNKNFSVRFFFIKVQTNMRFKKKSLKNDFWGCIKCESLNSHLVIFYFSCKANRVVPCSVSVRFNDKSYEILQWPVENGFTTVILTRFMVDFCIGAPHLNKRIKSRSTIL